MRAATSDQADSLQRPKFANSYRIDAHVDTLGFLSSDGPDGFFDGNDGHVDLPRACQAGISMLLTAIWAPMSLVLREGPLRTAALLNVLEHLASSNKISLASTASEAVKGAKAGKLVLIPTIEGAYQLGASTSAELIRYRNYGVQAVTLFHTDSNQFGDSSTGERIHGGLSSKGRALIQLMNELGVAVDLAHASDESTRDAIDVSSRPVFVSHTCCRHVNHIRRNISDELIKEIAARGGVICICVHTPYLVNDSSWKQATVKDVVHHMEHVCALAGPGAVGFGSDFDGGIEPPVDFKDISKMPALERSLVARGFLKTEIDGALGNNLLSFLNAVQKDCATPSQRSNV